MHSLRFTTDTSSNGVAERDVVVGDVPGVLWSPVAGSDHAPLVLMGHGGGLHKKTPALRARAHHAVATWGFTVVALDAPGHGDRPCTAADEQARTELLPWDDEYVDRQSALALFDAFASTERRCTPTRATIAPSAGSGSTRSCWPAISPA